jgi:hypothetical protein
MSSNKGVGVYDRTHKTKIDAVSVQFKKGVEAGLNSTKEKTGKPVMS